jgi:hypothetical protein
MSRGKLKWLLAFLLVFGLLGYSRDNFFVYVNNILYEKFYNTVSTLETPFLLQPLESWSYSTLYYAKYPFTLAWTAVFFLVSYAAIKTLMEDPFLVKLLVIAYAILLILAGMALAWSYLVHGQAEIDEYTLSRWLLGAAQSPLICFILLAAGRLLKTEKV